MTIHPQLSVYASILALWLLLPTAALPAGDNPPSVASFAAEMTDRLIIKLRKSAANVTSIPPGLALSASELPDAALLNELSVSAGMQLRHQRRLSGGAQVLRLSRRMQLREVESIARRLRARADVEYAVPDRIMQPQVIPNDTQYANQWHFKSSIDEIGAVNLPAAWDISTGAPGVVMAVIDTGVLLNHVDLLGRTLPGLDMIGDPFVSNDGDGRDADPSDPGDWVSSGFCSTNSSARNSSWHGTHVSGTLGAASNNGAGVAGVNWLSGILPVRVLGRCGGYESDVLDGMRWAAGLPVSGVPNNPNPARVLNLSLGSSGSCDIVQQTVVNEVNAAGTVVVAAAGNSASDVAGFNPANCAGVIAVAATNRQGGRASYSNYGAGIVISAPGGQSPDGVLSTFNTGSTSPAADDYRQLLGTSMATPHVVGIVALMLSANPLLTPAEVQANLQATARPFPIGSSCNPSVCGPGIIDAAAAVGRGSRLLKISTSALGFDATRVGQTSAAQVITLSSTNTGTNALTLASASLSGANAADFSLVTDSCSGSTLAAQASCSISISFNPTAVGLRAASLSLPGNAANLPQIALSGTGTDSARFAFSAATYSVNEAAGTALVTVTRSGNSAGSDAVAYASNAGSATAGVDYSESSGTLNFAAGEVSHSFSVAISNDTLDEPDETVNLSLSNFSAGATAGDPVSAVLNILDDDLPITLTLNSVAIKEGNAGNATVVFTATLAAASEQPIAVNYVTANGTATAGVDFQAASGTLNFAPGTRVATLSVTITGDAVIEPNETFFVNLFNPADAAVQLAQGRGIILNDDQVLQFSSSGYQVNEAAGTATISVLRVGATDTAVSVQYSAGPGGTATSGSDYTPVSGTLSFAAGDSTPKTFTVPLTDDGVVEPNESITLSLSNPSGGAMLNTLSSATLFVLNDDTSLQLRFRNTASGSEGISLVTVEVTRIGTLAAAVAADYSIGGGSATAGTDYTASNGSVSFAANDAVTKSFSFAVINDDAVEPNETVSISLSNPSGGATLGVPSALTYTILNDDASSVQFSAANYSVNETAGSILITITRSGALGGVVTVNYLTANGTATPGSDYTLSSGTLSFNPGESSASFSVPIIDDTLAEKNEVLGLILSSPGGTTTLGTQRTAILTIVSNE